MLHRMQTDFRETSFISGDRWDAFMERRQDLAASAKHVNLNALTVTLEAKNKIYASILQFANEMLTETRDQSGKNFKEFYAICSNVFMVDRWLWGACFAPNDDIYYKTRDHEHWKAIDNITEEIILDNDQIVMRNYKFILDAASAGLGSMSRAFCRDKGMGVRKWVKAAAFASVYYMVGSKRDRQSRFFLGNPCMETQCYAVNLGESNLVKSVYDYFLPSVDEVKIIRVPKLDRRFTLENLKTLPKLDDWRNFDMMDKLN